jgi:UDP-N-acetylmuramoylalanine--D-glutamate ligase
MNNIPSNNITHIIFGLGVSGMSCARYFDRIKQPYFLVDTRNEPLGNEQVEELTCCQGHSFGKTPLDLLQNCEMLIVSPGISLTNEYVVEARKLKVEIVGDVELFARKCEKKIVAITGSNGKSTVTELTEKLLLAAGEKAQKGGNIGLPVLDFLPEQDADIYVLELSSFQLDTTRSLQAEVAVLLNISEDHMDRYSSFEDYCDSKRSIFINAKNKIFNWDDRLTSPTTISANDLSFSFEQPKEVNHVVSYMEPQQAEFKFVINKQRLATTNELKITGAHNWLNALVSLSIVERLGVELSDDVIQALKDYQGLAHRFQLISRKHDCLWINDSKATNVGATLAALSSLKSHSANRIFLIAGGDSKNADLDDLKPAFESLVYCLVLIGKDADRLSELSPNIKQVRVNDLNQAIKRIKPELAKGDVVLLSPACASLDMFKNFEERGMAFVNAVEECA